MKRIKICGVGSVILGDDAVGPFAARWLTANYEFGEGVEVEDLGTPGLDLVAYMTGIDVLILIDSCDNGAAAGTVTVYDKAAITRQRPAARLDPHAPCITECIFIGEMAGDGPREVYLIGVTGQNLEPGTPMSPEVQAALPKAAEVALEYVRQHGGSFTRREQPQAIEKWWWEEPIPAV